MTKRRILTLSVLTMISLMATVCLPKPGPGASQAQWDAYNASALQQEQMGAGAAQAIQGIGTLIAPWTLGLGIPITSIIAGVISVITKREVEKRVARAIVDTIDVKTKDNSIDLGKLGLNLMARGVPRVAKLI